jgi:hypothetical protein
MCPHWLQVREVYAGSTYTTGTPARRALYAMNCPSWANDQLEWVARWGLRSRTRSRMPVSSSRAIPRPVRSASATTCFAILWLMSRARRASLRRRFFSRRSFVRSPLSFRDLAGGVQEPHAVAFQQVGLALAVQGQGGQLLRTGGEGHVLDPSAGGPDRHRALGYLPGQHAVVVGLGALRAEDDRLPGGLAVALLAGLAEVFGL